MAADMDNIVEPAASPTKAEIIDESQGQTRRKFLVAHPPPGEPAGFIDNGEMLRRVPVSLGTLQNWRRAGKIPYIKGPGRRIFWHWPTVEQALLRMQRGGVL
jgi:hypothetical protein